jgi:hypothetical protein
MPIDKNASVGNITSELVHSWRKKGTIGTSSPSSELEARKQALAIAFNIKRKKKKKK